MGENCAYQHPQDVAEITRWAEMFRQVPCKAGDSCALQPQCLFAHQAQPVRAPGMAPAAGAALVIPTAAPLGASPAVVGAPTMVAASGPLPAALPPLPPPPVVTGSCAAPVVTEAIAAAQAAQATQVAQAAVAAQGVHQNGVVVGGCNT
eukprot:CAMPEP_0175631008 /NCGR_PEP_ID=MMETSP0096-20121207/73296_1 /TAXON_ID=311494 /ORGANISM="Alexandrium monilatum, Strain CCMP3105" /LENGTH=148 /DNA_ID=CAMNT_0016936429 /DNA_START=28 /DNA_END=470 /DNA_ORIENTATION=+